MDITKMLFECGIVPVIKIDDAADAVPLCNALTKGGVYTAEITFRTNAAAQAIKNVADNCKDVCVGAGTVLTVDLAKQALEAGAKYIITPGFNRPVVEFCLKENVAVFPGVSCPTDIETALSYGLSVVKFFPAEANGGLKALKAMAAPYGMLKFMPTGGIDVTNLQDYLSFDKIVACGGSWFVKEDLIKSKNWDEITKLTKAAVNKMHGFEFTHMAINANDEQDAKGIAALFGNAFGFNISEKSASVFANPQIEIMYGKGPGECGHIAIKTINVARAIAYFNRMGIEMDMDSVKEKNGVPNFVYFKNSFGPFKVHLLQA